ncbi:MAG: polysaccharide export protein [Rhodospirillaceae bacterium]|nr:polysaccharide export protein [Rhodospirillaceae bacterium]
MHSIDAIRLLKQSAAVMSVVLVAACAWIMPEETAGPTLKVLEPKGAVADLSSYRIHPGDAIRISTLDHEDASIATVIAEDGSFEMPFLGIMTAADKTVVELRDEIAEGLNAQYIVDPKVNLEITKYRPYFVLGQIVRPGSYEYQVGLDVRRAVATSGGYTRRADEDGIRITRRVLGQLRTFSGAKTSKIMPGDVVEIDRRWF